jgi:hypothetical protein
VESGRFDALPVGDTLVSPGRYWRSPWLSFSGSASRARHPLFWILAHRQEKHIPHTKTKSETLCVRVHGMVELSPCPFHDRSGAFFTTLDDSENLPRRSIHRDRSRVIFFKPAVLQHSPILAHRQRNPIQKANVSPLPASWEDALVMASKTSQ